MVRQVEPSSKIDELNINYKLTEDQFLAKHSTVLIAIFSERQFFLRFERSKLQVSHHFEYDILYHTFIFC